MTKTNKLRERINKSLDFFTEPGEGEKHLKDLEDQLLSLFTEELSHILNEIEKFKMVLTKDETNSDYFYGYGNNQGLLKAQQIIKQYLGEEK